MRHEILRSLLFIVVVSVVLRAATPAPGLRRSRPRPTMDSGGPRDGHPGAERPLAGNGRPDAASDRSPDRTEAPVTTAAGTDGRRRRGRYRGRRGGANWTRHGRSDRRTMMIGHLNIQSLKPKIPELRTDIADLYGFDVMGLAETWLTANVPSRLLSVPGYKLYRADRPRSSGLPAGHGGVAILARETLEVTILPRPSTETQQQSNLEIIWAKIRMGKERQFIFSSAYRHPTNTVRQLSADMDDLNDQLNAMITLHPRMTVFLTGDFNACLLKTDLTPGARLSEVLALNGLVPVNVRTPTYRPAGSLLDVIAINQPSRVIRSGVTRCHYGGPHDITRLLVRHGSRRPASADVTVRKRCLGRVNVDVFNDTLYHIDWNVVWTCETTTESWDTFCRVFLTALDTVAPLRRVRQPPPGAPLLTAATRDLLARRRCALTDKSALGRERYKDLNRQCRRLSLQILRRN